MPNREQIETVVEHIKDIIGRNYIEGDGDMCSCWFQPEGGGSVGMTVVQGVPVGTPEPFVHLPDKAKIELLDTYVDWKGFTQAQEADVIRRVLDGEESQFWMDDIKENLMEKQGTKPYEVWLNSDVPPWRDSVVDGSRPLPPFPDGYIHHMDVQANGLQQAVDFALELPNIHHGPFREWQERTGGVLQPRQELDPFRDPMQGDVIVDPSGQPYRFGGDRFEEISQRVNGNHDKPKLDLPDAAYYTGERARELHQELRTDYEARVDRMIEDAARQPLRDNGKEGPER